MNKKVIIVSFSLLLVIGLLIIIERKNKKIYIEADGIKYAILVNGSSASSFPSGNYKTNITCTNANAYWDSINQKIIVENIKGDVTCDVAFNSITNNDYLNTYITNLSGANQGTGQLVHETFDNPDYTNASVVTTFGSTPAYFNNNSGYNSTRTATIVAWSYANGTFTSIPSEMNDSTNKFYHVYVKVPSAGIYQICYTINQSIDSLNSLYLSVKTNNGTSFRSSTSGQVGETCYRLGYLDSSVYLNVSQYAYSDTSSPQMSFRVEKAPTSNVDTGYRYEGEDPNNYIKYNNEEWRIVGVFETEYDTNNDGVTDATDNLVKIVRNSSIGAIAWDKDNTNDWPNSSLYNLLNKQYYNWEVNKANVDLYCYAYSSIPTKCNFTKKGIDDGYREMIKNVKWYLGGAPYSSDVNIIPYEEYNYERDASGVYSGRSSSTYGYVGLLYISDYVYGVIASSYCSREAANMRDYDYVHCAGKDWLYGRGHEWTISQVSNESNKSWRIGASGSVEAPYNNYGFQVRPVVYLSSNIYRVSGTGSITDPYIIGMAS